MDKSILYEQLEESNERIINNRIIKDWWGNTGFNCPLENPKSRIYHYTSVDAFSSILSEHKLRLTKSDFMNDVSEIKYACDLFVERLKVSNIKNKHLVKDNFQKDLDKLFDNIFVLSFSYNKDSLLMWTNYGKNDGYNMEIDKELIVELQKRQFIDTENDTIKEDLLNSAVCLNYKRQDNINLTYKWLVKGHDVIYNKNKQIKIIDAILSEISMHEDFSDSDKTYISGFFNGFYTAFFVNMIPFFKNDKFSNEEEYRLLIQITDIKPYPMDIIKYRSYNGMLIPYIELSINNSCYFKSICLSPMNSSDTARMGLNYFAKNHVPKLVIRESEIPTRLGW